MSTELKPCPFCGAGETIIKEQTFWTGMQNVVLSVSVRHWCEVGQKQQGEIRDFRLEAKAKTKEAAVSLWNARATTGGQVKP